MSYVTSHFGGGSQAYQLYQIILDVQSLQQTLKTDEMLEIVAVNIHTLGMTRPSYPMKSKSTSPSLYLSLIANDGYTVYIYSVTAANTPGGCFSFRTRTNDSGTVYENLTGTQVGASDSTIYYIIYRQS